MTGRLGSSSGTAVEWAATHGLLVWPACWQPASSAWQFCTRIPLHRPQFLVSIAAPPLAAANNVLAWHCSPQRWLSEALNSLYFIFRVCMFVCVLHDAGACKHEKMVAACKLAQLAAAVLALPPCLLSTTLARHSWAASFRSLVS